MDILQKGQHIIGSVQLKSNLSIQEVGRIISEKVLNGIPLEGLKKRIYEEVPAIFNEVLGFSVVLQGYTGIDNEKGYWFELIPNFSSDEIEKEEINISKYLISLLREKLKANTGIQVVN